MKVHTVLNPLNPAERVVDAYVIEAILANVTALELMEPFVDIASTVNYTVQSRELLESAFIIGATIVINEHVPAFTTRTRRGHSQDESIVSAKLLKEGCIPPPETPSAILIQEIEIGGLHITNFDGSDMSLDLDLRDAGPGSYDMNSGRLRNKVVATADLNLQIPFIGSYHLVPMDSRGAFHSEIKEQGVRSHLTLSTEADNGLALQFSIDAMVTTLGVPWRARITHMSREEASDQFFQATALLMIIETEQCAQ